VGESIHEAVHPPVGRESYSDGQAASGEATGDETGFELSAITTIVRFASEFPPFRGRAAKVSRTHFSPIIQKETLKDPDKIMAGQTIKLPPK
jgi:hypothetical protein